MTEQTTHSVEGHDLMFFQYFGIFHHMLKIAFLVKKVNFFHKKIFHGILKMLIEVKFDSKEFFGQLQRHNLGVAEKNSARIPIALLDYKSSSA